MKVYSTPSEKLLCWMFRMIIYGLKIIGLAPVSLQTRTPTRNVCDTSTNVFSYSKIGLFYNLILSILTVIIGTFQMRKVFSLSYPNKSAVNLTLDIAQYFLEIFTAWLAMVYWAFRQKKGAAIVNRLFDVHCLLPAPKEQSFNKRMLILLAVHMTFNASLWITFFVSAQIFYNSLFNTIAICTPIFMSYWFLVEYSMILGFLARELESLNANLLILETFPNGSFRMSLPNSNPLVLTLPSHKQLADIKLLHRVRATLDEVSQDIADFFSLPILPVILLYFCMIVYHIYYIIVPIFIPNSDLSLNTNIFVISWLIISVYPLILLSFYVTKTIKKAQLTGHVVHKLIASERKREVIAELEQFFLHVVHANVCSLSKYASFSLDFMLL